MTQQDLYNIARKKPILTETEINDTITDTDIIVMADEAWNKSQELLAASQIFDEMKKEPLTQDMIDHPEDYGLIDFSNFKIPDIDISELKIVNIEPDAEDAKRLTDISQTGDAG